MHESRNVTRPSADQDHDEDVPSPSDPGPGQDDPDAPDETPHDPGQDDPEDPCAVYEQAVAEAEAEVAALEARADELEREITDLANQVMNMEQEKQQILDILRGMRGYYFGARQLKSPIIRGVNKWIGLSKEEYLRQRSDMYRRLAELNASVVLVRRKMVDRAEMLKSLTPKLALSKRLLAQARADLRRCEQS